MSGSTKLKRFSVVAGLCAALVLPNGGSVLAHDFSTASSVTIGFSGGRFAGSVNSSRASCERRRRVLVKKVREGTDRVVGRDSTNRSGSWSVAEESPNGRYYAVVLRRVGGGYGHSHRCGGDRSPAIEL